MGLVWPGRGWARAGLGLRLWCLLRRPAQARRLFRLEEQPSRRRRRRRRRRLSRSIAAAPPPRSRKLKRAPAGRSADASQAVAQQAARPSGLLRPSPAVPPLPRIAGPWLQRPVPPHSASGLRAGSAPPLRQRPAPAAPPAPVATTCLPGWHELAESSRTPALRCLNVPAPPQRRPPRDAPCAPLCKRSTWAECKSAEVARELNPPKLRE